MKPRHKSHHYAISLVKEGHASLSYLLFWGMQVDIYITPGAHSTEAAVNKQLNDKARVAAALENPNLLDMVNKCLIST